MLVIENGDDPFVLLKRVGDLFKEPTTRIKMLFLVVIGILAVFTDADDSIHGNPVASDSDSLFNGVKNWNVVLLRQTPRQVPVGKLFDVHRRQFQSGTGATILLPALEDFSDQDIGVQPFFIGGQNGCHRLCLHGLRGMCCQRQSQTANSGGRCGCC